MYMHNYLKNNYCPYLEILLKKSILWEKRERDKDVKKKYFLFQWKITMNSKQISFKS